MSRTPLRMTEKGMDIAKRVSELRRIRGMSQPKLAKKLGVTYQQIHKYETGQNRIPSDRLAEIADALDVSPAWFFATGAIHIEANRKAA